MSNKLMGGILWGFFYCIHAFSEEGTLFIYERQGGHRFSFLHDTFVIQQNGKVTFSTLSSFDHYQSSPYDIGTYSHVFEKEKVMMWLSEFKKLIEGSKNSFKAIPGDIVHAVQWGDQEADIIGSESLKRKLNDQLNTVLLDLKKYPQQVISLQAKVLVDQTLQIALSNIGSQRLKTLIPINFKQENSYLAILGEGGKILWKNVVKSPKKGNLEILDFEANQSRTWKFVLNEEVIKEIKSQHSLIILKIDPFFDNRKQYIVGDLIGKISY